MVYDLLALVVIIVMVIIISVVVHNQTVSTGSTLLITPNNQSTKDKEVFPVADEFSSLKLNYFAHH